MLATLSMKVRRVEEWDIGNLPSLLAEAKRRCKKSVAQVCREAGISTAFWYEMLGGRKSSIKLDTLDALCKALGVTLKDVGIDE